MFIVRNFFPTETIAEQNETISIFAFAVFSIIFLTFFVAVAYAQVQFYGVNVDIDDKHKSTVQMTITFSQPVKEFNFTIIGSIQKFGVNSTSGSQNCILKVTGITVISCKLNLTQEKRTIILSFETFDFVKDLDGKFFLDTDFSLTRNIEQLSMTVRLPEGKGIVSEDVPNRISFPEVANIISDGRHIIVNWRFTQTPATQPLKFQVLYETIILPPLFDIRIRYAIIAGAAIGLVSTFVYLRYFRKPEKLILSVLDEYERKIFDLIVAAGGTVNQKKIVQETNLSKAKVSRVVKSLVGRGVIEVERMGRTNKLKVLKRKFMM
ncbi:MAG TPA: helix-turn-helix domain-containing protein [archaeon]|nr:helix-turn-helix domain-containing protein [archaeon]